MSKLVERREELRTKSDALAAIFAAAGTDMDLSKVEALKAFNGTAAKAAEIKRLNDELTELGKEVDSLASVERMAGESAERVKAFNTPTSGLPHPNGQPNEPARVVKSLGQRFVESTGYKDGMKAPKPYAAVSFDDYEFKTTMETTAGWAPAPVMTARLVPYANRRVMLPDIIPSDPTNQSAVRYMEETTFTNTAAPVAEKGNKPEATLAFTERTVPIEVIATWIPVTRQQLEDVPTVRGLIDNRLSLMVRLAEEVQLLTGNGVTPQLLGFLVKPGVQTQAKGADPTPDAIYKGMTLVRNTGMADPTAVVFHPNDWQDVRLLRTADGVYIWGSPADAGPERIWGVQVIQTTAETENTALLGDFQLYSHISRRTGMQVFVTDSHASLFIANTLVILVEERVSLEIYRGAAFAKVTGI